jgi:GR25 family glycosyltransferase involved in LPS biosynthesis
MVLEEAPQYALCLNMIVKDESHIIKDTLTKLFQKIKFDYWIISDTGSTDKTKEIITEFFKEVGIPGELYEDEWVDFSHNRNKALEYAFGKSKYLLIFDADDEICGDFVLPELVKDYYHFQFGSHTKYTRTQIINNCKRWKYVGVLHEYIVSNDDRIDGASMEVIKGHYYTVSGRSGNRNLDSNKYLKDAIILEKAYYNAVDAKDDIYHRYGFYCANSYYDCDKYEHAISWYKKTLENCGWSQEKYVSCLKLYTCYEKMNNIEAGFFYLVKSAEYDRERAECYYELIKYYSGSGSHDVAYGYYGVLRDFYNNSYLKDGLNNKLFLDESVSEFYLPYYVIIVSEKMRDYDTGIQMYRIIFTKKCKCFDEWFVGNLLYNLQFFTEHVKDEDKTAFYSLFQEYVDFLVANNYPLFDETMKIYEKYGIKKREASIASDECLTSKKILIYTGFMDYLWNDTYVSNNPIGGAEKAVAYLARNLPKEYEIIISGDVADEVVGNVKYVNRFKLQALLDVEKFHTIIVSRYVSFFLLFPRFNCHQLYLSAHDSTGFLNNLNDVPVHTIIEENNKYIKGVICLTTWHKLNTIQNHACLKDKVSIINNGILVAGATSNKKLSHNKIKNKFVWTSCSYRGLDVMLKLWDEILEVMPDATLDISSYDAFPSNKKDEEIQMIINRHSDSVKHHGKLNTLQLHDLISKAEYWLYTNTFCETSCITAFEMLMHEVVCLYYPLAGLVDTIGEYGIQVNSGNEIQIIMNLSEAKKVEMRINGKKYAMSCSWENRAKEWASVLGLNLTYPIYIINLKRRKDRRENVEQQLKLSGIDSYNFVEAVDGKALNASSELFSLFERNDFNFNKGVIGCALSHIHLWNNLINDKENDFYIILEDDITFCDNFKKYLGDVCKLFVEQKLEHLALGEYNTSKVFPTDNFKIDVYYKDLYKEGHVTFAYIISKNAAKKYINYINSCSIKCAIDNPQAVGYILNYSALNVKLVHCQIFNEYGTDIQSNNKDNFFEFTTSNDKQLKILKVSFCDWWNSEYCGGCFDLNNNFFTNLLREYGNNYEIKIINPSENPDILFYSIFGFSHKNYKAGRKIFFSGEPYPQRDDADFNVTFDENSFNNTRVPLWLCYFDKSILEECKKRKNNQNVIPNREKFCSFVASGPGLTNNRKEFVEKLSKYKQVDCGGSYLNNIGYNIPIGSNCSGKIEHNNNYKFATAFESAMYKGYVTEKICDVFKSNCVPIYWGHPDVVKDYNPKTFINANDFENFDELVDYIIKVDNDEELYKSFFKEQIIHPQWIDILLNDTNKLFFKNLADKIIGKTQNIFNNLHELSSKNKEISSFSCYGSIYNIKLKNILEQINYNKTNDNFRNYIFEYGIDSNKKDVTDIIINILESTMQNFVIPIGDDIRAQLFGDNCRGHVKKIFIYNKNNPEQTTILTENESKIIYFDEKYNYKFVMGFYDNGLSERGTTTMMFSYADYAEKYFKCKSIIFYNKHHHANNNEVINRFSNRFDVYRVENFDEIDRIISDKNIKYFYNTCAGKRNCTELVKKCKNLIHAVFDIEPFGDKYSAISDYIVKKSKYPDIDAIPYMIDLPIHNDNMIHELNLPDNAFIIGRIGGYEQFDIKEAHTGIINFLNNANNTYFVFVNTAKFYEHPQIIYLDKIVDPYLKVKYINTCNCMIHARSDGETFGLAIAEFSSLNKPIVTCRSDKDNCHLDILGEKAIIFDSETSLIDILKDIKNIVNSRDDWNAYKEYTPDKVMKKFMNVFMPEINNSYDNITFDNINYIDMKSKAPHFHNTKELVIVSAFLDINREKWSTAYKRTTRDYILSFSNYFNYNTKMLVFIDDKYIEELEEMYNNSLHNNTIFIPINNDWMTKHIYAWQLLDNSKHIMQSDEYRNLVKDRIACGNPENIYADYNAINHSKIDFICYAINNNLINRDDFICWSDFGYFNSILHNNPSEYPINHLDITKFNPNKLSFCLRNKLDNKDKDTIYTLVNAPERFTGSFFAGSATLMIKLQELYHISLKELYSNNISDDDQHIYLRCFLKEPNIFNLYLDSCQWPKGLCYFEKLPDRFELVKTLLANIKNGKFVEIGCDTGTFSKYILTVNKTSTLYSVDPYISYDNYFDSINYVTGDNLHNETNMKLTQEFGDRFKLIREFSNKACNLIPDNLNFVYIDGNHQYEYVYEDLCLWWEKLAPNGIIVGDDAVDTDETKRDKNGNIFIEWCPGSYGKYGVIHAFNRFIIEKKCYGQVIGNQFVLFK